MQKKGKEEKSEKTGEKVGGGAGRLETFVNTVKENLIVVLLVEN